MKSLFVLIAIICLCQPVDALPQSRELRAGEDFIYRKAAELQERNEKKKEKQEQEIENSMHGATAADMFENRDPMFSKDAVATTFAVNADMGNQITVGKFDDTAGARKLEKAKEEKAKQQSEQAAAEQITDSFGNPDEDPQVLADEKAPKAYKGMMAALNTGDTQLAFRYARQYIRYVSKVQDIASTIGKMLDTAKQREGLTPPLSPEDPGFDEDSRDMMAKDLERVRGKAEDGITVADMSPEVKALLERAADAEHKTDDEKDDLFARSRKRELAFANTFDPTFDEQKERARVRSELAGRAPIDPKGQARLLVFINASSEKSMVMARDAQKLAKKYAQEIGSTLQIDLILGRRVEAQSLRNFITSNQFTIPVQSNPELGSHLGVASYPALVVVAPNSGKVLLEEGYRPGYYMEELFRAVQGFK